MTDAGVEAGSGSTMMSNKSWMESCNREVRNTRTNVGLNDVSTLGKIDIQGPDAGEFLNRLYTNGVCRIGW